VLERWNKFNGVRVVLAMTETLKLPVLPLADSVVLPGMVVPLRLDNAEIQAAVDAAQSVDRKVLVVPGSTGSTRRSARSPCWSRSAGSPAGRRRPWCAARAARASGPG
jgi:ATP-dependent Lon protease